MKKMKYFFLAFATGSMLHATEVADTDIKEGTSEKSAQMLGFFEQYSAFVTSADSQALSLEELKQKADEGMDDMKYAYALRRLVSPTSGATYDEVFTDFERLASNVPGEPVPSELVNKIKYFETNASYSHIAACYNLGLYYAANADYSKALEYFNKLSELDANDVANSVFISWGKFNLAKMYSQGLGVDKDEVKAKKLFKEAADLGHTWAQYHYATMSMYSSKSDIFAAKNYYEKAAFDNLSIAQYEVGLAFVKIAEYYEANIEKVSKERYDKYLEDFKEKNGRTSTRRETVDDYRREVKKDSQLAYLAAYRWFAIAKSNKVSQAEPMAKEVLTKIQHAYFENYDDEFNRLANELRNTNYMDCAKRKSKIEEQLDGAKEALWEFELEELYRKINEVSEQKAAKEKETDDALDFLDQDE